METMRGLGCTVGEYVGNGKGDSDDESPPAHDLDVDADDFTVDQSIDEEEDSSGNAQPLLIFYDCETTGFSIYNDHITDIGAMVVQSPVPLSEPTFSKLVKTSRRIPAAGIIRYIIVYKLLLLVISYQGYGNLCSSSS